jgi:ubiquinone biosynthesis protein COQ4
MHITKLLLYSARLYDATPLQRLIITAGSGIVSILDPYRDDMISAFGELTGQQALPKIYKTMRSNSEGLKILHDRPIINSKTVNLDELAQYPEGTFGREYADFLKVIFLLLKRKKKICFYSSKKLDRF